MVHFHSLGICIFFFHVTLAILFHAIQVLISFAAIVYFYVVIYLESKRHYREIKVNKPLSKINRSREFRAAKTTAVIFGCLLIYYRPSFVAIIINKIYFPRQSIERHYLGLYLYLDPNTDHAELFLQPFYIRLACSRIERCHRECLPDLQMLFNERNSTIGDRNDRSGRT